ncbi:MAG: Arc family DNA-binding protein [Deltaproteobacteria bacterium]|nr:Arc family DNA-binding protein [Deltaproteobacteria bacterium]
MPALTIKNIPHDLYEQLKETARLHHRSLNSEILYCIEQTIGTNKIDIPGVIKNARKFREKTSPYLLTDDELNKAKDKGRP